MSNRSPGADPLAMPSHRDEFERRYLEMVSDMDLPPGAAEKIIAREMSGTDVAPMSATVSSAPELDTDDWL